MEDAGSAAGGYSPRPVIDLFLQTLVTGLAIGSLYALIALGYTMVYGILKFINFAHSDVFVLGAWISFTIATKAGWSSPDAIPWWSGGVVLLCAMLVCGAVGFTIERLAYKPLRRAPRLNVLITAIGVSLLLQNIGQLPFVFGTRPQGMPQLLVDRVLNDTTVASGALTAGSVPGTVRLDQPLSIGEKRRYTLEAVAPDKSKTAYSISAAPGTYEPGSDVEVRGAPAVGEGWTCSVVRAARVPIRLMDVMGAGTALVLMFLLDRLVFHTRIGRAMRAVSHNPANASLMGIPVNRIISITFVIGAVLAAAAGFLFSQKYSSLGQPAAGNWVLLGLKAFVAAVVGGIGNVRGAMMGGVLIGLLEQFGTQYLGSSLRDVYVFALLIVVLLVRPSGLLGKPTAEKV